MNPAVKTYSWKTYSRAAGIACLFLLIVGLFVFAYSENPMDGLKIPPAHPLNVKQQLFSPLAAANLDRHDPTQICVSTLPSGRTEHTDGEWHEAQAFCTDFRNVHIFVSEAIGGERTSLGSILGGTYASINFHYAHRNVGYGTADLFTERWTDFITVYVQTEKERQQWQTQIDYYQRRLYSPRPVKLETPNTEIMISTPRWPQ